MAPFRSRALICTALAAFAAGGAAAASAGELTVVVADLNVPRGAVHLALWNRAEGFTDSDAALIQTKQPAAGREVRFELGRLDPGLYALAAYHDENGNGHFDRNWIGWPNEGLAFSNGAWIGLGAPSFKEAAFEVHAEAESASPQVVVVRLRYPGAAPAPQEPTDSR